MILVPSRQQLLNGNKIACLVVLLALASCSRRTTTTGPRPVPPVPTVGLPSETGVKSRDHSLALLLPFQLNSINVKSGSLRELSKADLAIEFYQGFKLAMDSLSERGHNFNVQVLDSDGSEARLVNLAQAPSVRGNDIVIGPVFPDAISTFSDFSDKAGGKLQVSPLAAASPSQFRNPNLVTVNNTVDQHGYKIADYITRNYKPENINVVIINTRKTDDEKFTAPIRRYLKELSKGRLVFNERPNAIGLQTHLKRGALNIITLSSSERTFVLPIIDRLFRLSQEGYRIELFGHPNWTKLDFLDAQKMQALNTRVTSSFYVDYKSRRVKNFVTKYRSEYSSEPSEYSFKGFDTGYFFGGLLEKYGSDYKKHLTSEEYNGLHNKFHFSHDPSEGYLNSTLSLLEYRGFELRPVE